MTAMPSFSDHFSAVAPDYAAFRPRYPAALFDWLAAGAARRERAWDCGTGSGQAALGLAGRFAQVVATDPSVAQLGSAVRSLGVDYAAMTAERSALAGGSVDLVTVAQALHWFEHAAFFGEVQRVLRPGGMVAVWSYGLLQIDPGLDPIIATLYRETLGSFWPAERALVDAGYAGIDFPFAEIHPPVVAMEACWTLPQLVGYLSTWSAVRRFRDARGEDPLRGPGRELEATWGPPGTARAIHWPLAMRVGRMQP
jgi:SAM-dependent methyltransferase